MKIGFIGAGGIAGNYLASLARLGQPVAAVCDINADQAAKVAAGLNAKPYSDHRAMLEAERPDAVFICLPPGAHDSQTANAALAGAAIFTAKPVGLHLDQALRTRDAIAKSGVVNSVGYMARYSDVTDKAKELVNGRALGLGTGRFLCRMPPNMVWWSKRAICGGQMLEQTTHVFDWFRYFLGEAAEAHAFGHRGFADDVADFEDATVCNLRFASGAVASITSTLCASAPECFVTEISGRDIYLRAIMDNRLEGSIDGQKIDFTGEETGYFRQIEQFLEAVRAGDQRRVRCSFEDGLRTLAVSVAATRSIETGRPEKPIEV